MNHFLIAIAAILIASSTRMAAGAEVDPSTPNRSADLTSIQRELESQYPIAKTSTDGAEIVVSGDALVLQKDNLVMNKMYMNATQQSIPVQNVYTNGQLTQAGFSAALSKVNLFLSGLANTEALSRSFVRGDKIFATKITVEADGILVQLISDSINNVRYHSTLKLPIANIQTAEQANALVAEVLGKDIHSTVGVSTGVEGKSISAASATAPVETEIAPRSADATEAQSSTDQIQPSAGQAQSSASPIQPSADQAQPAVPQNGLSADQALDGCMRNSMARGALIGGIVGGVLGHFLGGNNHNGQHTAIGALVGGAVGGAIAWQGSFKSCSKELNLATVGSLQTNDYLETAKRYGYSGNGTLLKIEEARVPSSITAGQTLSADLKYVLLTPDAKDADVEVDRAFQCGNTQIPVIPERYKVTPGTIESSGKIPIASLSKNIGQQACSMWMRVAAAGLAQEWRGNFVIIPNQP